MIRAFAMLIMIYSAGVHADSHPYDFDEVYSEMETCVSGGDFVSLRILASRVAHHRPSVEEWSKIRELLHENPSVGWDMLWKWDHLPGKKREEAERNEINKKWNQADTLMAAGRFSQATPLYLSVRAAIAETSKNFGDVNFFARQTVQHSLARSLYGEGRFNEALEAYQNISLLYPFVRQVQFEKMWAAFRAKDYSLAVGSIASQMSSYFNRFMEPEAYLVQYYVYRELCRKSDMAQVFATVKRFKKVLASKRIKVEQWARFDLETMILLRMAKSPYPQVTGMVSEQERNEEVARIKAALDKRYTTSIARVKSQLEKVFAYLNMASAAYKGDIPEVPKSTDLKGILTSETEMWPVQDAEDWLDEIGHHHFIGKSECK